MNTQTHHVVSTLERYLTRVKLEEKITRELFNDHFYRMIEYDNGKRMASLDAALTDIRKEFQDLENLEKLITALTVIKMAHKE